MDKLHKQTKKNRHVLVENGVAFLLLVLIILLITIAYVYFLSIVQFLNDEAGFLYANQMSLDESLKEYENLTWLEDNWLQRLDQYGPIDDMEIYNRYFDMVEKHGAVSTQEITDEQIESMSERDRLEYIDCNYYWIKMTMENMHEFLRYSDIRGPLLVYSDGTTNRVLMNSDDSDNVAVGSQLLDSIGECVNLESKAVTREKLYEKAPIRSVVSFVDDSGNDCFGIVTRAGGKAGHGYVVAYIGIETIRKKPLKYIDSIIRGTLVDILIAAGIYMVYFYFKFVKPLTAVKSGLQTFAREHDTDLLIEDMHRVRSKNEIGRLSDDIADMADKLRDYDNVVQEQAKAATELQLASEIQLAALPDRFPTASEEKRFEIYASMKAAKDVGGDLYDFFFTDEDHLVLVVGDVSGKGIPAALFMMEAKTMIKDKANVGISPGDLIRDVNEQLIESNSAQLFITIWIMTIELSTGRCVEVNAGHMNPILCRAGGKYEMVKNSHSMVVGIMEDMEYEETRWQLQPGDRLFIYSDGVTEAENEKQELFGNDRLLEILGEAADCSQKQVLELVGEKVGEFAGQAGQFDDITMLGFTYLGADNTK